MLRRMVVAVIALASTVGCMEETPSLHPLFTSSEMLPGLEGDWRSLDGEVRLRFEATVDGYDMPFMPGAQITIDGKTEPFDMKGRLRLGRLSGQLLADITAADGGGNTDVALWPVHVFARVNLTPGRLEIARLSESWLHKAVTSGQIFLDHEVVGEDLVITASTEELQKVVGDWAFHEEAFEKPTVFLRPRG